MITKIVVESFKSLERVDVELGILNVFVGANGSGKSNLLEAIGVLSAAAGNSVNDQTLLQRGVRPGVPILYKSAFPSRSKPHIYFRAVSELANFEISLNNPLNDPSPAWKFKTELLERQGVKLTSRGPNMAHQPNKEFSLAALKVAELPSDDPAGALMTTLRDYVIYFPVTAVLRGSAAETQPRHPIGLSGGRLPEATLELLQFSRKSGFAKEVCDGVVGLVDWISEFGSSAASALPLSPAARASAEVVMFRDRFMAAKRNVLSGYDAAKERFTCCFLRYSALIPVCRRSSRWTMSTMA